MRQRLASFRSSLEGGWKLISEPLHFSALKLAQTTTLLYVVFYPAGDVWLQLPMQLTAALGLLHERLREQWMTWAALAVFGAFRLELGVDNHHYLFCYWCSTLALHSRAWEGLEMKSPAPERLTRAARLLLGTTFLLATVWKALLSEDFLDVRFFTLTLLLDERFAAVARVLGGAPQTFLDYTQYLFDLVRVGFANQLPLPVPPQLLHVATLVTWWTIAIEAALGILYLLPLDRVGQALRDVMLLGFLCTTYAIAPVVGFGWLLAILGLAQSTSGSWRRAAFLSALALLLAFSFIPTLGILGEYFGAPRDVGAWSVPPIQ
jgi:hypothetical protein